ncbi:MAG TPA: uroporphyrinogen-III synthase [Rhizomicrobium sp.]|nr:uroporphyrinogen-III synthase [Rhizomicrobium sp.]
MRVLITRPREDGEAIAATLAATGHQPLLAPVLATRWFDGPALDLSGIAAILATSANGVRALSRRTARRDVPIFAVGPQTTAEAEKAGFVRIENADGDAKALADAVPRWLQPKAGTLLHVCGEQNPPASSEAAGQPNVALAKTLGARGYDVRREILYAVEAQPLPPEAITALAAKAVDAALFFSPRSARIFVEQAQGLPLEGVTALCISPATATALPGGRFAAVRIASRPNQDALLALLQ